MKQVQLWASLGPILRTPPVIFILYIDIFIFYIYKSGASVRMLTGHMAVRGGLFEKTFKANLIKLFNIAR